MLAYRRALFYDSDSRVQRARENLEWLHGQMPSWVPSPKSENAIETLYFWRRLLTPTQRHLLAAVCFAAGLMLLAPWGRKRRSLRYLAILPFVVWAAVAGALILEPDHSQDAVVTADAVLRAADSEGAPAAFPNPLPAGTEVRIEEERSSWTRLQLANGATGWLPSRTLDRVALASPRDEGG